jgi:hypothetical protein
MPKHHTYLTSPRLALQEIRKLRHGPSSIVDPRGSDPIATLTPAQREQIKRDFHLWWDSWVAPCLTTLERRHSKTRVKK